jgi:hypothetical protein
MTTIIISHRTTVAMTNSIHALLSENHPCTLFMVSLHPGYHDPPNSIHYHNHILRFDDGAARGDVLFSELAASPSCSQDLARWEPWLPATS